MVWPLATNDVISRNNRNWPSLDLTEKCARGINKQLLKTSGANVLPSKKKRRKTLGGGNLPPYLVSPTVKIILIEKKLFQLLE